MCRSDKNGGHQPSIKEDCKGGASVKKCKTGTETIKERVTLLRHLRGNRERYLSILWGVPNQILIHSSNILHIASKVF